jgi:hypothetical protein
MNTEDDEFNRVEREAKQRMAAVQHAIDTASTYEQAYENGFIDGMQHQMRSSVDKAVNRMAAQYALQRQPSPIPLITDEEWEALNKEQE